MNVDIQKNEAGGPTSITISDGQESLSMIVRRDSRGVWGDLKGQGQTWNHGSHAEINLLILHAREAVTLEELIADLGPSDEERIAAFELEQAIEWLNGKPELNLIRG